MHVHVMHDVAMLLGDYLSEKKITDTAFAVEVGVGRSMITKLRLRKAKPSFDTALKIQQLTDGSVKLEDLAPVEDQEQVEAAE